MGLAHRREERRRGPGARIVFPACAAGGLLALNLLSLDDEPLRAVWADPSVLLTLYCAAVAANGRVFRPGVLCLPNIFLTLLCVFHLGYYVPAKLGLASGPAYLPGVDSPYMPLAVALVAEAILSFELGALAAAAVAMSPGGIREVDRSAPPGALVWLGVAVTSVSGLLLCVFVLQTGGPTALVRMSYLDYVQFLAHNDPRFGTIATDYVPVGLLTLYVGLQTGRGSSARRRYGLLVSAAIAGLAVFLLWLGSRGIPMLSMVTLLYLRHSWVKRVSAPKAALLLGGLLVVASVVREIREVPVERRHDAVLSAVPNPISAILEMGGTIRPYLALVELTASGQTPHLGLTPYAIAASRVLPNLSLAPASSDFGEYYRSTVWITRVLDPVAAAQGFGAGSSGIGEPYACFGQAGVAGVFLLLGAVIGALDIGVASRRSPYAAALVGFIFMPLAWYIRDDVYGTLRPVVWGCVAIVATFALERATGRPRRDESLHRRRHLRQA